MGRASKLALALGVGPSLVLASALALSPALDVGPGVGASLVALAHDPQTSGGLLAAIPPERVAAVETALAAAGTSSWRVGRVEAAASPGVSLA